ncbi:MAG: OmpA family protein [Bacteroidia bacterium]
MKHILFGMLLFGGTVASAQGIDKAYKDFDFQAGEKTLFEDNFQYGPNDKFELHWELTGGSGAAKIREHQGEKVLSYEAYYTRLKPKVFGGKALPEDFTVEYDTWQDAAYDGNPGVVVVLGSGGDDMVYVTPNKHQLTVTLPNGETTGKENPEQYFGEGAYYDRWVHISIAVHKRQITVYLDQFKMVEIADIQLQPKVVFVNGDKAGDPGDGSMPIYLRNFRIATGFPTKIEFVNGKFVTRNIKFDVNKATLKPESITIIKQVKAYLDQNPSVKIEIGGHTDSDGNDEANMVLSQQRADAVRDQLVAMGISGSRLTTKGFGESAPVDKNTTAEAKANNRRVEFVLVQ